MRILYAAIDQVVPGTLGGSTHVQAVAEGLAALGHEVHVAVRAGDAQPRRSLSRRGCADLRRGTTSARRSDRRNLRLLRRGRLRALATALRPDVVIERYHNFGGEGLLAARAVGARTVLEVNAPVVDYPGSPKRAVDRAARRRADAALARMAVPRRRSDRHADRAILPPDTPAAKVIETEWGADTVRFRPGAAGPVPFARQPGELIAVFAGAFRAWHGVGHLVDAMAALERRGSPVARRADRRRPGARRRSRRASPPSA